MGCYDVYLVRSGQRRNLIRKHVPFLQAYITAGEITNNLVENQDYMLSNGTRMPHGVSRLVRDNSSVWLFVIESKSQ